MKSFIFVLFVMLSAVACAALGQSAKELDEIGKVNADQCAGLKQVCRAAGMDKKYKKDCDDFIGSLNDRSNRDLTTGYEKLDAKLYPSATRYANSVCDYDPTLNAKKHELLDAIKSAQQPPPQNPPTPVTPSPVAPNDESAPKLAEAERAFANGDFEGASAAARLVTDKSLQGAANTILQKIGSYNSLMQEARQKEGGDIQGAIQSYRSALNIASRGPGDPAARISALEARHTASVSPLVPPRPLGPSQVPKPLPPDPGVEAARINGEARKAEARNLQEALKLFQSAERVQPGNTEAVAGVTRVQGLINSDPKEQAKVLADAIRAFYALSYAEAEDDLTSYLSSTTAKYRGAAYFYLGATRLSREVLDNDGQKTQQVGKNPQAQRQLFKDARNACYRPLDKYLSPVILTAWNASSTSPACAR